MSFPIEDIASAKTKIEEDLKLVATWFFENKLLIKLLMIGTRQLLGKLLEETTITFLGEEFAPTTNAKNLGLTLDSYLTYDYHNIESTIISKVLERCVLSDHIRDHLLQLINDSQHGFFPGKSCTTQLLEVLDYIGSLLDGGKKTDVVYMDMSKAFDKVHHKYLISKLRNVYGISGKLLRWFESYLINRKQRVTVLGATSSARLVLSGVPQGSI